MDPDAEFIGITDSLDAVREIAANTPDGFALALDVDLAHKQAAMIAGEDGHLASILVNTVLAITSLGTGLLLDGGGRVYGSMDAITDPDERSFRRGCVVGRCANLLSTIQDWPGDPLAMEGMDLHEVEHRVSELWIVSAEKLGVVPTIL